MGILPQQTNNIPAIDHCGLRRYCPTETKGGLFTMKRSMVHILSLLIASTAGAQAQALLDNIRTPEKAVATVNQTLEGTWLSELRPAGLPAAAPSIPNLVTFHPNGTVVASQSDGTQSLAHGVWVRVGD